MGIKGRLITRGRNVDLREGDVLIAGVLTVGALADASTQIDRGAGQLSLVLLAVLTSSVAWRRVDPWLTTSVAVIAFAAFQATSDYSGGGAFEVAAVALNFYLVGRRTRGRAELPRVLLIFALWLAGTVVLSYSRPGGSFGAALGAWALVGGLPFACGRMLETRRALRQEVQEGTALLANAQQIQMRRAAAEERNRMARELHDVIAHSVSVMVLQATGARGIIDSDADRASRALQVIEGAGRDALLELRGIVGVLHREPLEAASAPGLLHLDALIERARSAGLSVALRVDGQLQGLPTGVDLVAYRVVQEALTNTLKHAAAAHARVYVTVTAGWLEVVIRDDGRGAPAVADGAHDGNGLIGMAERVRLYDGEFHAGRRADRNGFEVRARIPLMSDAPASIASPSSGGRSIAAAADDGHSRWLDAVTSAALLVAFELNLLTTSRRHGPLILNLVAVAAIALPAVWRRHAPLLFAITVGAIVVIINAWLTPLDHLPVLSIYVLIVPSYTVAAWLPRQQAAYGLAFLIGCAAISVLTSRQQPATNLAGAALAITAAWTVGRAVLAHRALLIVLRENRSRLIAEHDDQMQLAALGERSRIAGELQPIIASGVTAMVVQAQSAQALLVEDRDGSDVALEAIAAAGRETLVQMRRLLGVLRHGDGQADREPRLGSGQIYSLIQRARDRGQQVELQIDGDPGTLPASVDLGLYRIVEDALESARDGLGSVVGVELRFGDEALELRLLASGAGQNVWPTAVMRERITLCHGTLELPQDGEGCRLTAHFPRSLEEVLT